ncbi:MAG TPA: hypothetical protein VGF94_16260 [Kofleriaceae bacterium]
MPAKRVQVHTSCVGCGQPIQLGHLATAIHCAACSWSGAVPHHAWRWIFAAGDSTAAEGQVVLGESRAATVECAGCRAAIDDVTIRRAMKANASDVTCASCAAPMPLRRVPGEFALLATALVGEGDTKPMAPAPAPSHLPCSNCGANLELDGSTPTPQCTFCGTRTPVPAEIWQLLHPQGLVHAFYVWDSQAFGARAAALAAAAEEPPAPKRSGNWKVALLIIGFAAIPGVVDLLALGGSKHHASVFAAPGSSCVGATSACSTDHASMLDCVDDKLVVVLACRGPKGCRATDQGKSVSCDYTFAALNDPCNVKDSACSTDHRAQLRCDGTQFVLASTCDGPDGCTVAPTNDRYTLTCDDHVAPPGSPCLEDGRFACATDGKSMLRCTAGHFALASKCKGPKACHTTRNAVDATTDVSCDSNFADVGDSCRPTDRACDTGGKAMLACDDGAFRIAKPCGGGCASDGSDGFVCRH